MSGDRPALAAAVAGRYRIEREIGRGGMATVYLAHDLKHDRPVALKVMRSEIAAALGGDRFLREIAITARLDHPHILTLIDSGDASGFLFYVVPYVRGESLRTRVDREKQLPLDEALRIAQQVASALDHAHRQGVIHRDIKPRTSCCTRARRWWRTSASRSPCKRATGSRRPGCRWARPST